MKVEIIAIGDEILSGKTINTNSSYLSKSLTDKGYGVAISQALPDDPEILKRELGNSFKRSDIIVTTGGLGPTKDDKTRRIIAEFLGVELEKREDILNHLKSRFGNKILALEDQAIQPKGATVFYNNVGTAPALQFNRDGKHLFVLPGVPLEMKSLWDQKKGVLEAILQLLSKEPKSEIASVHICRVPEISIDAEVSLILENYPDFTYGIYPDQGIVQVVFKGESKGAKVKAQFKEIQEKLVEIYGIKVFSLEPQAKIEEVIHDFLIKKGKTLALAESCSGGALSTCFTSQSGSSNYFLGSVVSYSNLVKEKVLGVSSDSLEKFGAVSSQVAAEMAKGALKITGADLALSITGIAGPTGGSEDKPLGLVYGAVAERGKDPQIWEIKINTGREANIRRSVQVSLAELWKQLNR